MSNWSCIRGREITIPTSGVYDGSIHIPGSTRLTRGLAYIAIPIGLIICIISILAGQRVLGDVLLNKKAIIVMSVLGGSMIASALLYLGIRGKGGQYSIPKEHPRLASLIKLGNAKVKMWRNANGQVFMAEKKGTGSSLGKTVELHPKYLY
jgi:hypothetical protein